MQGSFSERSGGGRPGSVVPSRLPEDVRQEPDRSESFPCLFKTASEPRGFLKGNARALACRFRRPRRKQLPSFGRFDFHPKVGGMLRPAMKGGGEENSSGFFRSRRGTAGVSLRRR